MNEASDQPGYRLVFLVGYPRSGTTWLTLLLAQHPAVTAVLHSGVFHALAPWRKWWQTSRQHGKKVLYVDNDATDGLRRDDLVSLLLAENLSAQLRQAAASVFDTAARQSEQTQVLIEKTPENLEFLEWILPIFPEAYILHIVRDPRSTYASIRRSLAGWALPDAFASGLIENTRGWCDYMRRGEAAAAQIGSRYRMIRYEDLLDDGVANLASLFAWLDLDADEAFCRQALTATGIDRLRAQNVMPAGFFHSGRSDSWRRDLSAGDIKGIEHFAGRQLAQMGYERHFPASDRPPFGLRWREFLKRAGRFVKYRFLNSRLRRRVQGWTRLFLR